MADRIVVMNHGIIEQVGGPAEIYARPASAFVADFVGTMNFLDATVSGPGQVRVGSMTLECPAASSHQIGAAVALGLRPEEIRVRGIEPGMPNQLVARVELLDYLGAFCRATLVLEAAPGLRLLADFSANAVRDLEISEGQTLRVALPAQSLRVYALPEERIP